MPARRTGTAAMEMVGLRASAHHLRGAAAADFAAASAALPHARQSVSRQVAVLQPSTITASPTTTTTNYRQQRYYARREKLNFRWIQHSAVAVTACAPEERERRESWKRIT